MVLGTVADDLSLFETIYPMKPPEMEFLPAVVPEPLLPLAGSGYFRLHSPNGFLSGLQQQLVTFL
jgi:hypothetical protein